VSGGAASACLEPRVAAQGANEPRAVARAMGAPQDFRAAARNNGPARSAPTDRAIDGLKQERWRPALWRRPRVGRRIEACRSDWRKAMPGKG